MKRVLLTICSIGLFINTAYPQGRACGTMQHLAEMEASDPGFGARMNQIDKQVETIISNGTFRNTGNQITIPVVFHILYANSAQNISNARINAQMAVLNSDYSSQNPDITGTPSVFAGVVPPGPTGTGIQFCLAQRDPNGNTTDGILRIPTTVTSFPMTGDPAKFTAQGGDNAWPRDQYLNIWVCNLGNQLLGYAQFPGQSASTDGVVLLYSCVGGPTSPGTIQSYNLGRSATHEIGHWLNLRHIWGDQTCGNDQVADTPTQQTYNFNCPNFPHVTSCTGNAPNGDMFMNYMDYVDDDCMIMFTQGQSTRMNACLSGPRLSILASQGCTPVGLFENTPTLSGISVFPNPATDYIIIQNAGAPASDARIRVMNSIGQKVSESMLDILGTSNRIDISNLAGGVYFIEVEVLGRKSVNSIFIDRK